MNHPFLLVLFSYTRKMRLFLSRLIITVAMSVLITSCASIPQAELAPPLNQVLSWQQRQQQLQQLKSWVMKGEIGGYDAQGENFRANVIWQQHNNDYHIRLFGLFGMGMTQIISKDQKVTLIKSNGQHETAPNIQTLVNEQLPWPLPISSLYYWIRSLPTPKTKATMIFDKYHHLTLLKQQGWTLHYLQYTAVNNREDLPRKIFMSSQGGLRLKLIVSQWKI